MVDKHIEASVPSSALSIFAFRDDVATYLVEAALDFVISVDAPDRLRVEIGNLGTIIFARHTTCWNMSSLSGAHIKLREHGIKMLREAQGGRT